jgi:hypothetical protein
MRVKKKKSAAILPPAYSARLPMLQTTNLLLRIVVIWTIKVKIIIKKR